MNCDEVRELLHAYALDALTTDERAAVDDHLDGCALHPELASLNATARALAGLADPLPPPPDLRGRILEVVRAAPSPPQLGAFRSPRTRAFLPWALAAAFAVLAAGLGIRDLEQATTAPALVRREAASTAGTVHGIATFDPNAQLLVVEVAGLPPASAERDYQLWVVRRGTPQSLGVLATSQAGTGTAAARTVLQPGDTIALMVEPRGGSEAPTTPPFLAFP